MLSAVSQTQRASTPGHQVGDKPRTAAFTAAEHGRGITRDWGEVESEERAKCAAV